MKIFFTIIRLLTFNLSRDEMLLFGRKHLYAGLVGTWVVGMGRYWDDDKAHLIQKLGLGSVVYIFLLSLFIWLIVYPFAVEKWSYFTLLTFISLTSFPAILYSIPVEKFFTMNVANDINVWFLAVVAIWRMALLIFFLKIFTRLNSINVYTLTLTPVSLIITSLFYLNLHRVVFNIMGGLSEKSPHDGAYAILFLLTFISMFACVPLVSIYIVGIVLRRIEIRKKMN